MTEFETTEAELLAEGQEMHPGREVKVIDFDGRVMAVLMPNEGQMAALARLGRSQRMDDWTRVASIVDLIEALLVRQVDKDWFGGALLGGDLPFGTAEGTENGSEVSALTLARSIILAFDREGDNREEKRAAKKAARKAPKRVNGV